jgi:hypothetical protein
LSANRGSDHCHRTAASRTTGDVVQHLVAGQDRHTNRTGEGGRRVHAGSQDERSSAGQDVAQHAAAGAGDDPEQERPGEPIPAARLSWVPVIVKAARPAASATTTLCHESTCTPGARRATAMTTTAVHTAIAIGSGACTHRAGP